MNKLTIDQGFDLAKKLFNSYILNDHILEDYSWFKDSFMLELGLKIFTKSLKWEGGSSSEEMNKFHKDLRDVYERFARSIDNDDTWDIQELSCILFEVACVLKDSIDVDVKPKTSESYAKEVHTTETKIFSKCPNCTHEIETRGRLSVLCTKCKIRFEIVNKEEE